MKKCSQSSNGGTFAAHDNLKYLWLSVCQVAHKEETKMCKDGRGRVISGRVKVHRLNSPPEVVVLGVILAQMHSGRYLWLQ